MNALTIFSLQFVLSLIVYGLMAKWYVTPWLAEKPINQALMLLLFPHALRHVGLTFFVPGVVAEPLPNFFANTAAYGDLASALLALLTLMTLRRGWGFSISLVWLFNIVGTVDLLNALGQVDAVSGLGTTWFIPTFFVPILLVTHAMIFARLLQRWNCDYQEAIGRNAHAQTL